MTPAFHPSRPDLVLPVRCDPSGENGPTPNQARRGGWRRSSRGFYVPEHVERTTEQRIVEASVFLRGADAITGWAALRWQGATWFDGTGESGSGQLGVPVLTGSTRSPQAGFRFTEERRSFANVLEHDGLAVTDPVHSTCFAMRYAPGVRAAVVALDMACHADLVSINEVSMLLTPGHNGWIGVPQAREAVGLAVENSWSPMESQSRLVWELNCDFPRPRCNTPVFDLSGRHLLTPDLFDAEAGVVGEYNGAIHVRSDRRRRDRDREEVARDHGLEYFTVMAGDIASGRCEAIMRAARASEVRRPRRSDLDDRAAVLVDTDRHGGPTPGPGRGPAAPLAPPGRLTSAPRRPLGIVPRLCVSDTPCS